MNRPVIFVLWISAIVSFPIQEGSAAGTGTDDGACTEAWDTCRTTYRGRNVLANLAREHDPKVVVPDTLPLKIDVSHRDPNTCVTRTDRGTTFYGYRVVRRDGTSDVIGLYNTRGNFCGIQTRFPQYEILSPTNPFRYDLLPIFQSEIVDNVRYFVLTAYTCDPAIICNVGDMSNLAPENQAGDRLVLQNGPDPTTARNVINVPKRRKDALKIGFTDDNCFFAMGQHSFYRTDTWTPTNCTQILPVFLLQNKCGYLIGFAFFWVGRSTSELFEEPSKAFIQSQIGGVAPPCSLEIADRLSGGIGITSIHIWFTKKTQFCGSELTTAEGIDVLKQLHGLKQ